MAKPHRDDILFSIIGLLSFALLAGTAALLRMRLAHWYLKHCISGNSWCRTVDLATSYWWVAFVPATLAVAWLINRYYQARLARRLSSGN
jgi:membrane protein implicated in regulation of membrane protease activity